MIRHLILGVIAASLASCGEVSETFGGSTRYDYENAQRKEDAEAFVTGNDSVEPSENAPQALLSATETHDETQTNSVTSLPSEDDSAFPETDPAKLAMLRKYKMVPAVKGNTVYDRVSIVVLREGMKSSEDDRELNQVDVWRLSREMYKEECEAGDPLSCGQAKLMQNLIGCAHRDKASCAAVRAEFQRDEKSSEEATVGVK